jgi:outer membrane beta-barrel protein
MRALVLALLFAPGVALAEEDEIDMGRIVAFEARPYRLVHEFSASLGVLPIDSFQTAITIGASYTLHLSDLWAWEAISFDYAINVDTGVEDMLASRWSIAPSFDRANLQYLVGTHVLLTPLYGKLAVLDDDVIYADLHFGAGGGLAHYADGFRPQLSVGPGVRLFFGSIVSMRLDVAGHVVPNAPGGTDFLVGVNLSVSTNFGTARVTDDPKTAAAPQKVDGMQVLDELYPGTKPDEEKSEEP